MNGISISVALLYGGFLFLLMAIVVTYIVLSIFREEQSEEDIAREKEKMKKKDKD